MSENNYIKMFRYHDGSAFVHADPFEVDYRFDKAAQNEDLDLLAQWVNDVPRDEDGKVDLDKFTKPQMSLYAEACHRYIPLIQFALDLKPFDKTTGEGLPGEDVLRTWAAYTMWKADVKKNIESPPPSATPTDSDPNSSPNHHVPLPPPIAAREIPPIRRGPVDRGPVPSGMRPATAST